MLVDDLLVYDFVPSELPALRGIIPGPLPGPGSGRLSGLQEQAVRRGLFSDAELVLCGPAGSGKGALVELLLLHAAHCGQRAIVLSPFSPEQPLVRLPERFFDAELLVVDGLEAVTDAEVGQRLLSVLFSLQRRKAAGRGGPRLVATCLPFSGLPALCGALGVELVRYDASDEADRVRSLRVGVLCEGRIEYRPRAETSENERPTPLAVDLTVAPRPRLEDAMKDDGDAAGSDALTAAVQALARRGGKVFLLLPDQASCQRMASRLAGEPRIVCGTAPPPCHAAAPPFAHVVVGTRWRWLRTPQGGPPRKVPRDRNELLRLAGLCGDKAGGSALVFARSPRDADEIWLELDAAPPAWRAFEEREKIFVGKPAMSTTAEHAPPVGRAVSRLLGALHAQRSSREPADSPRAQRCLSD
jgi:hypothetical protein